MVKKEVEMMIHGWTKTLMVTPQESLVFRSLQRAFVLPPITPHWSSCSIVCLRYKKGLIVLSVC